MTCRSHILHAFAVAAMLAGAAFAQEEGERKMSAAERLRRLPKLATACDGLVGVLAADVPGDEVGFRLPILQFVSSQVRDLERAYKLQMPRRDGIGIFVNVGDGRTNDTRVVARRTRRPGGDVQTRIVLPSPGFSDLDELRFAVAQAYFRAWIFRNGGSTNELPEWVVQGAVRAANAETAHDDTRFVLGLWSQARLPYFPALCTDMRKAKGAGAALSGYLVAWMKEKHLVKPLLDHLAAGKPWDGRRLAAELTGETDPFLQDRASDERFARLTRAVLSPGRASDWDLLVFTSRLLLYPPVFDRRHGIAYTFREAVDLAAERKNIREAAWQKAREMPFCAIGRGDALADVAMSYREFLVAAAQGKSADELKPLLEAADGKMNAILEEQKK
jgi:hypothetical protein